MKHVLLGAAALATIAGVAYAQSPAANLIRTRQANYKQMAAALKGINDQLRGGSPAIGEIRPRARLIADHAVQVLRWFPHGTGAEAGVRTRARPEIWSDRHGFERAGAALLIAAQSLNRAAQNGNVDAVRSAMPALTRACSACHDAYRAPEH